MESARKPFDCNQNLTCQEQNLLYRLVFIGFFAYAY